MDVIEYTFIYICTHILYKYGNVAAHLSHTVKTKVNVVRFLCSNKTQKSVLYYIPIWGRCIKILITLQTRINYFRQRSRESQYAGKNREKGNINNSDINCWGLGNQFKPLRNLFSVQLVCIFVKLSFMSISYN